MNRSLPLIVISVIAAVGALTFGWLRGYEFFAVPAALPSACGWLHMLWARGAELIELC